MLTSGLNTHDGLTEFGSLIIKRYEAKSRILEIERQQAKLLADKRAAIRDYSETQEAINKALLGKVKDDKPKNETI